MEIDCQEDWLVQHGSVIDPHEDWGVPVEAVTYTMNKCSLLGHYRDTGKILIWEEDDFGRWGWVEVNE